MRRMLIIPVLALLLAPAAQAYRDSEALRQFIAEAAAEGPFSAAELEAIFAGAEYQQSVIDAISRPAERVLEWREYQDIFLTPTRIRDGVSFWQAHRQTLERAEATYGVPTHVVVAILGVETLYGTRMGRYRVLDSLATLAFDYPPRSAFFRGELKHFLALAHEEGLAPATLLGSYAGAMGYGQFISSSYRHFAVDFDDDGKRDIWLNAEDAIGSVANYLGEHGWQRGEPITARVEVPPALQAQIGKSEVKPERALREWLAQGFVPARPLDEKLPAQPFLLNGKEGPEYWLSLANFYAITRYNHSEMYAMAVYQLGTAIEQSLTGSRAEATGRPR